MIVLYNINPDHTLEAGIPLHKNSRITKDVHSFFVDKGHEDNQFSSVPKARYDELIEHLLAIYKTLRDEQSEDAPVFGHQLGMLQAEAEVYFRMNHGYLAYCARTEPVKPMQVAQQLRDFEAALRETAHQLDH